MKKISELKFINRNIRELPLDAKAFIGESRTVVDAIFARTAIQPLQVPKMVAYCAEALELLGVDTKKYTEEAELVSDVEKYLGGNEVIPNSGCIPYAQAYCGHQFGSFAGQLGDGASMYLGEVEAETQTGAEISVVELTLKGAGKTPFSRTADGRKVLRSSVREFLGSEAMHFLGIPTTRSASLVTSSSVVQRDPYYDGRVADEPCAVITRIAASFFRFGSFELFRQPESAHDRGGPSAGNDALKTALLDHVIKLMPSVSGIENAQLRYQAFFRESVRLTALLAAKWEAVGFVHGVLNTDNMSVLGLTIDYGPFAWMEHMDPDFTPNGSDGSARYSYSQQAVRMKWNLFKLAEALQSLVDSDSVSGKGIVQDNFDTIYKSEYLRILRCKLGLFSEHQRDEELIAELSRTMSDCGTDFTNTFRAFTVYHETISEAPQGCATSSPTRAADVLVDRLVERSAAPSEIVAALKRKLRVHRLTMHPRQIVLLWEMLETQPEQVCEMFGGAPLDVVTEEIGNAKANLERLSFCTAEIKRIEAASSPSSKAAADREKWEAWIAKYLNRIACDGKANTQIEAVDLERRVRLMRANNPTFILRNWALQDAAAAAERSDFSQVRTLLQMIKTPYDPKFCTFNNESNLPKEQKKFVTKSPVWAAGVLCTCSS